MQWGLPESDSVDTLKVEDKLYSELVKKRQRVKIAELRRWDGIRSVKWIEGKIITIRNMSGTESTQFLIERTERFASREEALDALGWRMIIPFAGSRAAVLKFMDEIPGGMYTEEKIKEYGGMIALFVV